MPTSPIDTGHLMDSIAIRDRIGFYFMALDRGDEAGVRDCFSPDLVATYHQRPPLLGREALMDSVIRPFLARLHQGEVRLCSHLMGNFHLERLDGDIAECETYATATHVLPDPADPSQSRLRMMSLRYLDRLRRTPTLWQIDRRVQTLDWTCELPATQATVFAQRIMARQP